MATSGTYTFTVTRDTIVREAMLNIGKLGETGVITAQEMTDCTTKLNMMVKQWMAKQDFAKGLKMWTRSRGDLFLSSTKYQYAIGPSGDNWAGGVTGVSGANYATNKLTAAAATSATTLNIGTSTISQVSANDYVVIQLDSGDIFSTTVSSINAGAGTITIATGLPSTSALGNYVWNYTTKQQRPVEILTAILRDSNQNDTPLNFMTLQTYENLPTKTSSTYLSDPTAIYYESQITNGQLYIDCGGAQDVTKQIHLVFLRPVQDLNNPTDNFDYPQQWYRPLAWGLSKEIAPMFNAIWTKEMEDNFRESLAMAQEGDSERSDVYFQCNDS